MIETDTVSSGAFTTATDWSSTPFPDFNNWFSELIREVRPDYVVGIARGALRLLQLQNVQFDLHNVPIVADYSLPFLSDSEVRGKRILLFDDSVIFGSTLAAIRQYLLARGAKVFCAAYIVDRSNFLGESNGSTDYFASPSEHSRIPVRTARTLWPDEIRRHHNKLINAILETKRDYNLDFPKVRLTTSGFSIGDIPYLLKLLQKNQTFSSLYDVSSPASAASGVYRYTALIPPNITAALLGGSLCFRPYSKARMIFMPEVGEIHVTPMPQLTVADAPFSQLRFAEPALDKLWQSLSTPQTWENDFYVKAVFRLLTFFVATLLGEFAIRNLISAIAPEFEIRDCAVVDDDIIPALGENNGEALKEICSTLRRVQTIPGITLDGTGALIDSHDYINDGLLKLIAEKWDQVPKLKPHDQELPYEIVGKIFLTLRAVTDSEKCRRENPAASRLDVGLTYEAIKALLDRYCGIHLTPEAISTAIDVCVDNGQAVPKVIRQDDTWLRAFYSGEAEDAHNTFQFKQAFHRGYSEFLKQRRARPLVEFDIHKLSATLLDIFPWLPISTEPYKFGRFARIAHNRQPLIGWLINRGTGPLKFDTDRKVLLLNERFENCVESSWEPEVNEKFLGAFEYIATAFAILKDSAPKLLLSTCRTHRHTYNAVAIEAYNWVEDDAGNFAHLISAVHLNNSRKLVDKTLALDSIYWCTRFLTEAREKHELFHSRFEKTKRKLLKAFERQGSSAVRFWDYTIVQRKLLDHSRDPEIELKFNALRPLVTQMRLLTAYFVRALLDMRLLTVFDLRNRFQAEGIFFDDDSFAWLTEDKVHVLAADFNENIEKSRVAALSIERTKLPLRMTNDPFPWYEELLQTVQQCFLEISRSLRNFAPHYKTLETDFPFAPQDDSRVLYDDSEERILRDYFVLTVEIIRSTDNVQTNLMKDFVVSTFKQFPNLYFEKTGNDAFLACSVDPSALVDIARNLMKEGERLKKFGGDFGGTRKGLSFGTFRHVKDAESHPRISDAVFPNVLPQAFGMLEGIDSRYVRNPEMRNDIIIVDESIAPSIAPLLNQAVDRKDRFMARGRHFLGRCYCYPLLVG